jgi:hypothetical protein
VIFGLYSFSSFKQERETVARRAFKFFVFFVLCFCTYKAYHAWDRRNEGFEIEKIHSTLLPNPAYHVDVTKEQLDRANKIFEQPFYYLGHGFQCYAFVSADDKYVLKFFRHQRLRLPECAKWLPDISIVRHFKAKKEKDFALRMNYLFGGIKVGFEAAPEDTALLFVHLNKTSGRHPTLTIYDKLKNRYEVALDGVEFMLQKKARLVKPVIDELMAKGDLEGAKARLDQIYDLLIRCAKRGVCDTDGALIRKDNLGYLEDRCIYIDSGKLQLKEEIRHKERFQRDLKRLRPLAKWLEQKYPPLAVHFEQQKEKVLNEF